MRITLCLSLVLLAGCDESSDQKQNRMQEQLNMQAVNSVGMPAVVNFQRKRTLKNIIELADKAIATTTYTQDMNGHLHKLCDSVGYGISAATQYTNPQKLGDIAHGAYTLPQADPDGLYSPAAQEGTWVMCLNPETKEASAVYVEPRIIVAPFALKE